MVKSANFGLPRIGYDQVMQKAMQSFLSSNIDEHELNAVAQSVRLQNVQMQIDAGIDILPCNDFSLYDHVLDTSALLGRIPRRYYWEGGQVPLSIYASMISGQQQEKFDAHPSSLRRWFNTNYLYVVPEFLDLVDFAYSDNKAIMHFLENRKNFGVESRPILLGPISYLMLGKFENEELDSSSIAEFLNDMLVVYGELFANFHRVEVKSVQFDEPFLVTDLTRWQQKAYKDCYSALKSFADTYSIKINVATYYGSVGNNLETFLNLPVDSFHIDCVHGGDDLEHLLEEMPKNQMISLGVVDAQNVWVNDLSKSIDLVEKVVDKLGSDRVVVAPSSSLFLCPLDSSLEKRMDKDFLSTLSFAKQKLFEVSTIVKAINGGRESVKQELSTNANAVKLLKQNESSACAKISNLANKVKFKESRSAHAVRNEIQMKSLSFPLIPSVLNGYIHAEKVAESVYNDSPKIKKQIDANIAIQQSSGVDIVTHGCPERVNDLDYFSNLLNGIVYTEYGYVQVSGDCCIKPPIIVDCLSIKDFKPVIDIAQYALSVVKKPLSFQLIGGISFVNGCFFYDGVVARDLYLNSLSVVAEQIKYLEEVGIKIICLNEEFLFKYVPLRQQKRSPYMKDLADIVKKTFSGIQDSTQIQIKCEYFKFSDIIESLTRLDADVLLLEASRDVGVIFESFVSYKYPNNIGFGLVDPRSNRVSSKQEMVNYLRKATRVLDENQLFATFDFGFYQKSSLDINKIFSNLSSALKDIRGMFQNN